MESYKIELEPYCENCPEFDAEVEETQERYASGPPVSPFDEERYIVLCHRTITCSHIDRCRAMIKHLKESMLNI